MSQPRPLGDWVDLSCQYQGVLAGRKQRFGNTYYLMRNVQIRPWSLPPGRTRTVDHLWFTFEEDPADREVGLMPVSQKLLMLEDYGGCGVIERYYRSNGTHDYGIKTFMSLCPAQGFKALLKYKNGRDLLNKVLVLENAMMRGRVIAPMGFDLLTALNEIEKFKEFAERLAKKQDEYEEIRIRSFHPKATKLDLGFPKVQKKRVAGFA